MLKLGFETIFVKSRGFVNGMVNGTKQTALLWSEPSTTVESIHSSQGQRLVKDGFTRVSSCAGRLSRRWARKVAHARPALEKIPPSAAAASSAPCKLPTLIPSSLSVPVLSNTLQHRVSNPLANSYDRQNDSKTQNLRNHPPLFEHHTHTYPQHPISLPHEMNRKIISSRVSTSTGTPDASSNTLLWGFLHRFQVKTPNEEVVYPFVLFRSNKQPPRQTPNN